jgi:predicted dienelactone hydrolase
MSADNYDPFARGPYPAGVRTIEAVDTTRNRVFPCEIWYPAAPEYSRRDLAPETQDEFTVPPRPPHRQMSVRDARARSGTWPLVGFSHPSFFHRRSATYLCTHLASHGYVVAALDHSEVVAPELVWREGATEEQTKACIDEIISSRVPDIRVLLERLLEAPPFDPDIALEANRVGIAGHSAGGWTALATPDHESRVRAVVALAPGGASNPRPGILPLKLSFDWKRDVPTLLLAAENDAALPLAGMHEIYQRIPTTKRMVILRRADHMHFLDNVEREHESFRTAPLPPVLKAIQEEMLPSAALTSGEKAHLFTCGLTTCHMDTFLRGRPEARQFLEGDIEGELASREVEATIEPSGRFSRL